MKKCGKQITVELITNVRRMDELRSEWDRAVATAGDCSVFCTFAYIRTEWQHFSKGTDQLFVIVVRERSQVLAIAPWQISVERCNGRQMRIVNSLGLHEGDKPGIVAVGDPAVSWHEVLTYVCRQWRRWDMLRLWEIPAGSPALSYRFPQFARFRRELLADCTSYCISLDSSWEDYVQRLRPKVRQSYMRRLRRFIERFGEPESLRLFKPEEMVSGLHRYAALEQSGWKKDAGIGVSKSAQSLAFYEDLLIALARHGIAEIHFLGAMGRDIAGAIIFKFGSRIYGKEITYNPEYADFSPGTLQNASLIKLYLDSTYRELDMMGLFQNESGLTQKKHWATTEVKTYALSVVNHWGMLHYRFTHHPIFTQLKCRPE